MGAALQPLGFARYLADVLIADERFEEGVVEATDPLQEASDIILTKSEGGGFQVVCIVDAEADPARKFGLDLYRTIEIARACRARYCMQVAGNTMPAVVKVVEVRQRVTATDIARLKPLRERLHHIVQAFAVDLSTSSTHTNARIQGYAFRKVIDRALREPRREADALARSQQASREAQVLREDKGPPMVTLLLLALLSAVFAAEVFFPVGHVGMMLEPSIATLVAMGGLARTLVVDYGEWYRLLTAALLHGGLLHLLLNGIALYIAGSALERLLGRAWLLTLFFAGALGGSLLSMIFNPPNTVSIGASGAIMGLMAAALAVSSRLPSTGEKAQFQASLVRTLVVALIPFGTSPAGENIDFAAHFGGALVGGAMGWVILATWPRTEPYPRATALARACAVIGLLLFSASAVQAARSYPL